jgi:dipeptidyl aminopeptidase/acylaminoacyl peptidase
MTSARILIACAALVLAMILTADPAASQDAPQQKKKGFGPSIPKAQITPHWFADDTKMWYRNDLKDGKREFILVDADAGKRGPAFDHAKLAAGLAKAASIEVKADRLPFDSIAFADDMKSVRFDAAGKAWSCDLGTYECTSTGPVSKIAEPAEPFLNAKRSFDAPRRMHTSTLCVDVAFGGWLAVYWEFVLTSTQSVDVSHSTRSVERAAAVSPEAGDTEPEDSEPPPEVTELQPGQRQPKGGQGERPRDVPSPDGQWVAFVRDFNVFIRGKDGAEPFQLSKTGVDGNAFGMLAWSPDSKGLTAFRIEPAETKDVYRVESSPAGGGRAKLITTPYPLPGDKFTAFEPWVFDVAKKSATKVETERIDFGRPRLRWEKEGHVFTYEKIDRGHQRLRLIEVDAVTGTTRNLIDEKADTFIWTAHTEDVNFRIITWLAKTDELIHTSEKDGWRHLYLIDRQTGKVKNQITKGDYVVRTIERIDEDKRQIWFRASGKNGDQDPYFIHYYRVNFDGSDLVVLTEANGTHTVQYSPARKYLIDTYSRVDLPPIHELRRCSDGKLVTKLEEASAADLKATGWEPPEVFTAKGRDGKTDIWGIICRPRNFDPSKKYPVIEQIYAGPQGSFTPKAFSPGRRFANLTDLGFIVVQMDGMGTANRSKAFHDVCWKNLKDAGFPDRILWHQAVAKKYPWYDTTRVGITGGSAGGQNSTGAVLFHPEFYKVAVSGCGCHDNRMDKASWNEQWMGYPVGPHYAACSNIDNAYRLRGKLLLIVGEMDDNVPPESTYRLCDALIKAGKDFDFVMVPGAGHGMGGAYGTRRMQDFFVRHLQGVETPDRNAGKR